MMSNDDDDQAAQQADAQVAIGEMFAYADQLIASRIDGEGTDLLSVLLRADVDGEALTQFEVDVFFMLLMNAGSETTRNLITGGTLALFEHPDQRALLAANPELLGSAIEEMLRWVTPVMHFRRTAQEDLEIAGQPIAAGDKVVMWYSSANRDEAQFPNADTLRHRPHAQRARVVRRGRPALLPRREPGPARGPHPVRGAAGPHARRWRRPATRCGCGPTSSTASSRCRCRCSARGDEGGEGAAGEPPAVGPEPVGVVVTADGLARRAVDRDEVLTDPPGTGRVVAVDAYRAGLDALERDGVPGPDLRPGPHDRVGADAIEARARPARVGCPARRERGLVGTRDGVAVPGYEVGDRELRGGVGRTDGHVRRLGSRTDEHISHRLTRRDAWSW